MLPPAELDTDTCYDCGREVSEGQPLLACLWKSPAAGGAELWGQVLLCPDCAALRDQKRRAWRAVAVVSIALITSVVAYLLLP
jgi:hypothetical protein